MLSGSGIPALGLTVMHAHECDRMVFGRSDEITDQQYRRSPYFPNIPIRYKAAGYVQAQFAEAIGYLGVRGSAVGGSHDIGHTLRRHCHAETAGDIRSGRGGAA